MWLSDYYLCQRIPENIEMRNCGKTKEEGGEV
jgi:hypothetical protein